MLLALPPYGAELQGSLPFKSRPGRGFNLEHYVPRHLGKRVGGEEGHFGERHNLFGRSNRRDLGNSLLLRSAVTAGE